MYAISVVSLFILIRFFSPFAQTFSRSKRFQFRGNEFYCILAILAGEAIIAGNADGACSRQAGQKAIG